MSMRFEEVKLVLTGYGYTHRQPRGGGSHHLFRRPGRNHISVPVAGGHVKRLYLKIILVEIEDDKGDDDE